MRLTNDLLAFPFDLFTRYYIVAFVIEQLKRKNLRIIEIGGRNGLLYKLLPEHNVYILDTREPENEFEKKMLEDGRYIIGNIQDERFFDDAFDVVVCLDVLEHVNPSSRKAIIKKLINLSKLLAVIGGPMDHPLVDYSERLINDFYQFLMNENHPWLKEHINNRPLPREDEIEELIKNKGCSFLKIGTNNIFLWTLMMHLTFLSHKLRVQISKVHHFYNISFTKRTLNDSEQPTYRTIYFISKDATFLRKVVKPFNNNINVKNNLKSLELIHNIWLNLADTFIQKLSEKDLQIKEKESQIDAIYSSRTWKAGRFISTPWRLMKYIFKSIKL